MIDLLSKVKHLLASPIFQLSLPSFLYIILAYMYFDLKVDIVLNENELSTRINQWLATQLKSQKPQLS